MSAAARSIPLRGAVCGLVAAFLFGLSAPLAKLLLPSTGPIPLASLLYLGAGVALSAVEATSSQRRSNREARLHRADFKLLFGIVVCGGIIGPILLMYGLARVSGVTGSLLLNLEAPFTIALAVISFREHLGRRTAAAAALIVLGAAVLGSEPGKLVGNWVGMFAIAAACLSWAIDNNLTQQLSLRDPVSVVRFKTLGAGVCTLVVAVIAGDTFPEPPLLVAALLVGVMCYGLSVVLDAYALRLLGAAREAALFATAPFVGAVAAVPLLGDNLTMVDTIAMLLMALGVVVLLREEHHHEHTHDSMEHDHAHVHDAHHRHEHPWVTAITEPHAHPHRHVQLTHDHPHVPDLHHRHPH